MPRTEQDPAAHLPPADHAMLERHADAWQRVRHVVTEPEWRLYLPLIEEIQRLKVERDALVLAHNYQPPEIFHGIADVTGDSLALAKLAREAEASTLVMCGVRFMAETAKLLNPERRVLVPAFDAGCTLADGITARDVRELRRRHPGVPIVAYVNTSVEVKAEVDICCTSSNAVRIVESLGAPKVIMVPDAHLASHVAQHTEVEIVPWAGSCVVHEIFSRRDIDELRATHPGVAVLAHPECRPEVQDAADYVGSTSGLLGWITTNQPENAALITECGMAGNIAERSPKTRFVQPCSICPYMKRVSLQNTLEVLRDGAPTVEIPQPIAERARRSVERMLAVDAGRSWTN